MAILQRGNDVKAVQIDFDGWEEYEVRCVMSDGELEGDGMFRSKDKAEARAAKLAKMYNCPIESNF